mmetsp:Transcript_72455/g.192462  ORF Transcript_72455/g.192462 Transcript_72455/m.192462 type:complete len:221 (+) Transcript_72455:169-831(+)
MHTRSKNPSTAAVLQNVPVSLAPGCCGVHHEWPRERMHGRTEARTAGPRQARPSRQASPASMLLACTPAAVAHSPARHFPGASCRSTRRNFPGMAPAFFTAVILPGSGALRPPSSSLLSLWSALVSPAAAGALTVMRFATLLKQSAHQLSQSSASPLFLFSAPRPVFTSRLWLWMHSVRPSRRRPRPWPSCQPYFMRIRLPKSDAKALLELTPLLKARRS